MMNTHRNLIQSIAGGNGELVLKFFANVSRFECALKRAGFVKRDRCYNAIPDWDTFANDLHGRLAAITDTDFKDARSYLLEAPPQKQMFIESDRSMEFKPNFQRSTESAEQYLLRLVRDVRNNLFHGGKYPFPNGPVDDQALRNSKLLESCLTILDNCRSLDANIEHVFEEAS